MGTIRYATSHTIIPLSLVDFGSQDSDDPARNPRKGFAAAASGSGGLFAGGSGANGLLAGDLGSGGPSNLGKVGNASASSSDPATI
jgi:hypothetical protein